MRVREWGFCELKSSSIQLERKDRDEQRGRYILGVILGCTLQIQRQASHEALRQASGNIGDCELFQREAGRCLFGRLMEGRPQEWSHVGEGHGTGVLPASSSIQHRRRIIRLVWTQRRNNLETVTGIVTLLLFLAVARKNQVLYLVWDLCYSRRKNMMMSSLMGRSLRS